MTVREGINVCILHTIMRSESLVRTVLSGICTMLFLITALSKLSRTAVVVLRTAVVDL